MTPSSATALTKIGFYRRLSLIGTRLVTLFSGRKVGEDGAGNIYYEQRRANKDYMGGRKRRWVLYRDIYDASAVPPEWHGWLHYTNDAPLAASGPYHKNWQQPHVPNMTGSDAAYRPPGSIAASGQGTGKRASATGDYQAWTPN